MDYVLEVQGGKIGHTAIVDGQKPREEPKETVSVTLSDGNVLGLDGILQTG